MKLGLGKVDRLLAAVGDPHRAFACVHVAGTNGKGSVTRMLAEVLRRAGYRTGATTSPHLVSFTERVEVDGREIAAADVARLLAVLRPHVEGLDAAGEPPTFFEVVTALAFRHFCEAGVAWAVVEAGMGGRLDATNVVAPALTIVTNVDLDHQEHLGGTVGEIAREKAGIMKPGVPCVTAARGEALTVLKAQSRELRVPMSVVGEDYRIVREGGADGGEHGMGAGGAWANGAGLTLLRPTGESRYELALAGAHQRENAALVVAAVDALRLQEVAIPPEAVHGGLRSVRHPGRLQAFRHGAAEVLVDGAHNPAGARALGDHLQEAGWAGFDLVAGFCADKAWQEMLAHWAPAARRVWAVPVRNPRSLDPGHVIAAAARLGVPAEGRTGVRDALDAAGAAGATRIVVAGSLFLAGEAVAVLSGRGLEGIHGSQ